ncbi:MAG TPA: polysaccharide deacetylase family protein [Mesorhizobium sp.]|jgi:peptidoglycan/xylan/chitin deacetylase (PgdA/CDA1 family)|nr:polysaccharide deacetylase family protein [Mesorhizobium sp.]
MTYVPARDFIGYGDNPPAAQWPGGAKLALNVVVNYEEGAEHSIGEGDDVSETILSDLAASPATPGLRNCNIESLYEYGSRVGVWRLMSLFREKAVVPTFYVVGRALELNPDVGKAIAALGGDIVCHGWRWIDYEPLSEAEERKHIAMTVETVERLTGIKPLGWYTGRPSLNTRRLVVEHGGFLFDSDDYSDDLPFFVEVDGKRHLVVPHSFDNNDSRFSRGAGLETGGQFLEYLGDAVDWLLAEGARTPRMMTVSLHCRLAARPGRMIGLARFLDKIKAHPDIWICRRSDLARHWIERFGG